MSSGIGPIANLQGKVNASNALVVTLSGGAASATLVTISSDGIGVTSTDALVLQNTTDAAAGAQQMSGRVRFHGEGWKTDATAASQTVDVINELLPVQGAAAPTANLLWKYSINGGAYGTIATLSSAGHLTLAAGWDAVAASTVTRTALGTTTGTGVLLTNTTAAAVGAQQVSPACIQSGNGWKTDSTAASQAVSFQSYVLPVQGAAAPTGTWLLQSSINAGSYTTRLSVDTSGNLVAGSSITSGASLILGDTSPIAWSTTRARLKSPANSQLNLLNNGEATGIGLDFATDGTLKVRTTAQTGYGIVDASAYYIGGSGAATSSQKIIKKVTSIADNSATTVITCTVPNANQSAAVKVTLVSSNGGADAFESSRCAEGMVVIQRNSGVATAATAATLELAAIATNATGGSATHTLAYSVVLTGEGATVTETVLIKVTIDDSGNVGSNQVVVVAECINSEASGVTIA